MPLGSAVPLTSTWPGICPSTKILNLNDWFAGTFTTSGVMLIRSWWFAVKLIFTSWVIGALRKNYFLNSIARVQNLKFYLTLMLEKFSQSRQ